MTAPQATRQHRRYGLLTHQIARENIRSVIFASSEERCRQTPMLGSISFTQMDAFRKRHVGPMFGAGFMTYNRRTLRLWRVRPFNESLPCTGSRKTYGASRMMSAEKFASNFLDPTIC